ncbi:uncharacterized protein LOC127877103 [Dreissena polymorpha]|uniref:MADF domain-containing protein n=1 Tax=Dreissena polymorpha TaxID=45954 RepID=A0A9D4KQ91_DREPO|nr:uncharacterized protein LOC127877103 [Dreissena polymorpha]KAH3843699.1 hypothetical protein DPMN_117227 [Dreissena polymorpha]
MAKSTRDEERKFILECIDLYRDLPALWKVTCEDYSNRVKKEAAYITLLEKYRERYQDATKEDVKKKFNALRTNFRKELKKVIDSEKYGAGTEDLFESSLWYYDAMLFVQDQETPAPSRSFVDKEEESIADDNTLENTDSSSEVSQDTQSSGLAAPSKRTNFRRKKRTIEDKRNELMELACKRLREPEDDTTSLVQTWVNELKHMEPKQQLLSKKAINDILFEGRMGTLKRNSVLINPPEQSFVQHRLVQPESISSRQSLTPTSVVCHGSFHNNQPTI